MANYTEKPKKKKKTVSRDIALDKLDFYDAPAPKRQPRQDKIKGRPKNIFVRCVQAVFPQSSDSSTEKLRKLVMIAAVLVFVITLFVLFKTMFGAKKGTEINNNVRVDAGVERDEVIHMDLENPPEIILTAPVSTAAGEEPVPEETYETEEIDVTPVVNTPLNVNFDNLISKNPDTRAWIKITGMGLDDVVVQGDDNEEYLTKDFYGDESVSGTIFSHYKNKWDGTDENIILFGHNMYNGDAFASVRYYVPYDASREPIRIYKKCPTVMLATPQQGSQTYKIFAGILVNTQKEYGEVFKYASKTSFRNKADFNNFIINVMDRSWFFTDVDITYGDQLLTLSTCYWPLGEEVDTRWVLFARKVRPGESEYVDTSLATRNYNAKLFDYFYARIGGEWYGSNWDKKKLLSYSGE
ncbi:MAG: class B sortase [Ruminococcaceae bacterium]|nr:class B sortase [Oscillospiraceae bacterium]